MSVWKRGNRNTMHRKEEGRAYKGEGRRGSEKMLKRGKERVSIRQQTGRKENKRRERMISKRHQRGRQEGRWRRIRRVRRDGVKEVIRKIDRKEDREE